ncbi:MAG: Panacea domain-containing protein [Schwartzia sp. (in: firmicutes)]
MKPIEWRHSASDVAKWFLQRNYVQMEAEDAEYISNLKLQKLLYYAQGVFSAITGSSLFDDALVAWEHGPVVIDVYHEYAKYGACGIEYDKGDPPKETYTTEEKEILEQVYQHFGQYSAWKLRNMTHEERPWKITPRNKVIKLDVIRAFFKKEYVTN